MIWDEAGAPDGATTDGLPRRRHGEAHGRCISGRAGGSGTENTSLDYNSDGRRPPDFKFELFPLHSPLLGESLLVSFPPLIDMLKFSG